MTGLDSEGHMYPSLVQRFDDEVVDALPLV